MLTSFQLQVLWAERQHVLNRNKRDGMPLDPKFNDQWYLVSTITLFIIYIYLLGCSLDIFIPINFLNILVYFFTA